MKEEEIMICACSSAEHQIVLRKDDEEKIVYCEIHLNTLSFWERLKYGIKYIFGYKCKYGAFEEFIFDRRHVHMLKNVINIIEEKK